MIERYVEYDLLGRFCPISKEDALNKANSSNYGNFSIESQLCDSDACTVEIVKIYIIFGMFMPYITQNEYQKKCNDIANKYLDYVDAITGFHRRIDF